MGCGSWRAGTGAVPRGFIVVGDKNTDHRRVESWIGQAKTENARTEYFETSQSDEAELEESRDRNVPTVIALKHCMTSTGRCNSAEIRRLSHSGMHVQDYQTPTCSRSINGFEQTVQRFQ